MTDRARAPFVVAGVLALTGLAVGVMSTVVSGVEYASAETSATGPGATPAWILLGQAGGAALLVIGLLALLLLLARLLIRSRAAAAPSPVSEHHVETRHQHLGTPPPGSR